MNGIEIIPPILSDSLGIRDVLFGAILDLSGASVSSIPKEYLKEKEKVGSLKWSNDWELLDPEKVSVPEELPDYWKKVYFAHNREDMKDCRELKYRYVHTPEDILPRWPRIPCKGVFCLVDSSLKIEKVTGFDLIHLGNLEKM